MSSALTPIETALANMLATLNPVTQQEDILLEDGVGRVLAQDCLATMNVPPHACSAMDGYGVIAAETDKGPVELKVSQRIPAGKMGVQLNPGEAARIFTGAPIPEGADSVVMQENCEVVGDHVTVLQAVGVGENLRPAGDDVAAGSLLFKQGHRLLPQDLGVLASCGIEEIRVRRKLKIALLTTGDEIVLPGEPLLPGQIYNSNFYTLSSLLSSLQVELMDVGIVKDDFEATKSMLEVVSHSADCIITTGGVSVGEEDHVKAAVEELGKIELWKLAIKPGKPFASGKIGNAQFFGLPGNPVSAFVTFVLLVKPALLTMLGCNKTTYQSYFIKAGFATSQAGSRQEYLRVSVHATGQDSELQPYTNQSSGVSASLSFADGLAVVPRGSTVAMGDSLRFIPFSELLN